MLVWVGIFGQSCLAGNGQCFFEDVSSFVVIFLGRGDGTNHGGQRHLDNDMVDKDIHSPMSFLLDQSKIK